MSHFEYSKCPACGYDFNSETKTYEDLVNGSSEIVKQTIDASLDGDEEKVVKPFLKMLSTVDDEVIKIALENYLRIAKIKSLNVAKKFVIRVMKNRAKKIEYERKTVGYLPPEK
jgi:hypothetical protein|tara:strand:+ start:253 stop:594 length:342 start_codon:yes stop_codon:yes gene_type:complete